MSLSKKKAITLTDKRSKKTVNDKPVYSKIKKYYKFKDYPLAIINHGINAFNGKQWLEFAKDYENRNRHIGKSLDETASDFCKLYDTEIRKEFLKYKEESKTYFCFLGRKNNKYTLIEYELKSTSQKIIKTNEWNKKKLVTCGNGKDYIINCNYPSFDGNTLIEIFSKAIAEMKKRNEDILSDDYDIYEFSLS